MQTVIPVRKPSKKQFVAVHPSPEFRAENMPTIEDESTGEIYLLAAHLEFPTDIENKLDLLNRAAAIDTSRPWKKSTDSASTRESVGATVGSRSFWES